MRLCCVMTSWESFWTLLLMSVMTPSDGSLIKASLMSSSERWVREEYWCRSWVFWWVSRTGMKRSSELVFREGFCVFMVVYRMRV